MKAESDKRCYKCDTVGHLAKDCPSDAENKCYTCNEPGHIARDCPIKHPGKQQEEVILEVQEDLLEYSNHEDVRNHHITIKDYNQSRKLADTKQARESEGIDLKVTKIAIPTQSPVDDRQVTIAKPAAFTRPYKQGNHHLLAFGDEEKDNEKDWAN